MNYDKTVEIKGLKSAKRITDISKADILNQEIREKELLIIARMLELANKDLKISIMRQELEEKDIELQNLLREYGFIE